MMANAAIHLSITGMSCGHCVASVEKALNAVSGVEQVEVDLEAGTAVVTGDASVDALITAVVNEGFEAQQA